MLEDLQNILESLLFVSDEPLSLERLKKIIPEAEGREIAQALRDLDAQYEARRSGFFIEMVAGGYQLRTRPAYTEWIRRLMQPKPVRLSKAALETLAIVAYKQPIIRADIEHIRGVDCGGVLRLLLERRLVRILGRKEIPGRPLIYATTRIFLEVFGLKDLKDLPTPKEIEALEDANGEGETDSPDTIPVEDALFSEDTESEQTALPPEADDSAVLVEDIEHTAPAENHEPDASIEQVEPPAPQPEPIDQDMPPEPEKPLDDTPPSDYTENPDKGG